MTQAAATTYDMAHERARLRLMQVEAARLDAASFCAFVLRDELTGKRIHLAPSHTAWHRIIDREPRVVIWGHPESGKALPLDEPVPTPDGWKTMRDLRAGDFVFGADGAPTEVLYATAPAEGHRVFRVRFDDGASVRADADHLWTAWTLDDLRAGRAPRVVTTTEMGARLTRGGRALWFVPMAGAAQYPAAVLPVHPYVLGVWLGDGDTDAPVITQAFADRAVVDRVAMLEGGRCAELSPRSETTGRWWVGGSGRGKRDPNTLKNRLKAIGVFGAKHIPEAYLTASEEQRRELLAGLLDTDGTIDAVGKNRVEFTSVLRPLARGVLELARSLGFKATIRRGVAKLDGRVIGPKWRVSFTARVPVFKLQRKLDRQVDRVTAFGRHRSVVAVEELPSVPVRCIKVAAADSNFLVGKSYTVTHNSQQIAVGRVLWELGRNPNLRIVVISATEHLAKKLITTVRQYIDRSPELRLVFPHLHATPKRSGQPWSTTALTVERSVIAKDPSIQAASLGSNILGSRVDVLVLEDVLTVKNTRTPTQLEEVYRWITGTPFGRLSEDARVWAVTNAWHPKDAMERLVSERGFRGYRFPVTDQNGVPSWPERFSPRRLAAIRRDLGTVEYTRQMLCVSRDDAEAIFRREWIDVGLTNGRGYSLVREIEPEDMPPGYAIFHGVDLAVSKATSADLTAFFTILLHPGGQRQVINIEAGRWSGPEIVRHVQQLHERYGGLFVVENVAAQDYILQFAAELTRAQIRPFTTGANKVDPSYGVQSLAAELEAGWWIVPSPDVSGAPLEGEVEAWVSEMVGYDPARHTGDRIMAAWFAREGARAFERKAKRGREAKRYPVGARPSEDDGVGVRVIG